MTFLVLVLLIIHLDSIYSYATLMLSSSYCKGTKPKALVSGVTIMGATVTTDSTMYMQVTRDSRVLSINSEYIPGETLVVSLIQSGFPVCIQANCVYQATGAKFTSSDAKDCTAGGFNNRVATSVIQGTVSSNGIDATTGYASITMPAAGSGPVTILGATSVAYGTVSLSPYFTLTDPANASPSTATTSLPSVNPSTVLKSTKAPTKKPATTSPSLKPRSSVPTKYTTPRSSVPTKYTTSAPSRALAQEWSSQGANIYNSRYVSMSETQIRNANLQLNKGPTHFFNVDSSVYATPAIFGDYLIFPDDSGFLHAFNKTSGSLFWKKNIKTDYFPNPKLHSPGTVIPDNVVSRTTPAKYLNSFLIGTIGYASILRIDIKTGALIGKVRLSAHPTARITMSGTVVGKYFYVGVASLEELASGNPSYPCCSFVGSFHSIDIPSMSVAWTWYTIPPTTVGPYQYSGAAIWGSSPSIDTDNGIVYFATGDNYYVPDDIQSCYNVTATKDWEKKCNSVFAPENWFEAVIGLNMKTGAKVWAKRLSDYDAWSIACVVKNNPNCPIIPGLDYDFGMAPVLSIVNSKKVLFIGQKSGIVYSIDASSGAIIWAKQTSPGSIIGGHSWGISVDDKLVYASVANYFHLPWTLKNGTTTLGGGWVALDKVTGDITWTTANPAGYDPSGLGTPKSNGRIASSWGIGPSTAVGNILLVGSADSVFGKDTSTYEYGSGGYVYSLSKTDGRILSSYETKAGVYGGFSADKTCAFIGHGYPFLSLSPGKGVFGFCTRS